MSRLFVLPLVVCFACAHATNTGKELEQAQISAAVYMAPKQISYTEYLNRQFKMDIKKQRAIFEGLWDADRELSVSFARDLDNIGYSATPISQHLGGDRLAAFHRSAHQASLVEGESASLSLDDSTISVLTGVGMTHLVLLRCFDIGATVDRRMWRTQTQIRADLIVYNLTTHQEIFRERVKIRGEGDGRNPRSFEANQMATLKAGTKRWISKFVQKQLRDELRW